MAFSKKHPFSILFTQPEHISRSITNYNLSISLHNKRRTAKMVQNKALIYKAHPTSWPEVGKHLVVETTDFNPDQEPPKDGFTAKVHYISFDPYQRGRMRAPEIASYAPPFELNKPITNAGVVSVIKSSNKKFKAGDLVFVPRTWTEEYSVLEGEIAESARVLENPYGLDPKIFVGALGMPGLTAYSSFYEIGEPKKGQTIL